MPSLVMEVAVPGGGGAVVTVTTADPDLELSATLVAVTLYFPAVAPAVKTPPAVMVPPVADQVTAVLEVPVTAAEKG